MTKATKQTRKICGNCRYHNTYNYPDTVFCFDKFAHKKEPVVSIMSSCDEWEGKLQDCSCLDDYSKKHKKSAR